MEIFLRLCFFRILNGKYIFCKDGEKKVNKVLYWYFIKCLIRDFRLIFFNLGCILRLFEKIINFVE